MQSCLVSNQLKRETYVSEIYVSPIFGPSSSGKIPSPLQRQKIGIHHFWTIVVYQHSSTLTLELEAVALEKVLRNVTSNLRLPSVWYLKNIKSEVSNLSRPTN